MMTDPMAMGTEGGPVSALNYKRAVLKLPPREFTVEVLSPTKQGSNVSYGLRVCPIIRSKRSSDSRSTSSSYSEYEIWRRWEDCLDFQETLEQEYSKMSRQKVKVLKRGATAKKKGDDRDCPYTFHQAAASFDSLPEGPDPREVAIDVHKLIPQLTRKGTLFRASRSTLKQRGDEFAAMIQSLFNSSEDAPVLLQELRNSSSVRDFFGFWRRDKELLKKSGKDVSHLSHYHSQSSLSTSFSLSTTPSSPASSAFPRTPISPAAARHSMLMRLPHSTTECSQHITTSGSRIPASAPPASHRFDLDSPVDSQFSASSNRGPRAATSLSTGSMLFTDELLLEDDPSPDAQSAGKHRPLTNVSGRMPSPLWGSHMQPHVPRPPTNIDMSHSISEDARPRPQPRPRSSSVVTPEYRNARIFVSTPNSPFEPAEYMPYEQLSPSPLAHGHGTSHANSRHLLSDVSSPSSSHSASISSRPSNMSMNRFSMTSSVSSYALAPSKCSSSSHDSQHFCDFESYIDPAFGPPHSPIAFHTSLSEVVEQDSDLSHRPRNSFSSFASCRTEASADGVLPRHLRIDHRAPLPADGSFPENGDGVIDTYIDHKLRDPPISKGYGNVTPPDHVDDQALSMEALDKELPRYVAHRGKHSISSVSSGGSIVTEESQSSPRDAFAVKAVYRDSVVVFRAERNMSLASVRQRLQGRFALYESVPLDEDFVLAYLPSRTRAVNGGATVQKGRSNSITSSTADVSQLRLLQTEIDWQTAMTTCGGKVTLRVLDAATRV